MANPFREAMGGSQGQQRGNRNLAPGLLQYMQNFQGNPMQILQQKVNESGINQDQYNQLHNAAFEIYQRMMNTLPRG